MKIIYYSPHPELPLDVPSGPGVHMREIIKGFEAMGHEVHPVIFGGLKSPDVRVDDSAKDTPPSLKQRIKPVIPKLLWQTMKDRRLVKLDTLARRALEQAINDFNPDLIYERGYYMMTSGVDAAKAHNIPHILEMNAPYPEERTDMEGASLLHQKALRAERRQIEATRRLVVVSSALRKYADRQVPGSAQKTIVTPNAIDPERFKVDASQRTAKRSELKLGDAAVIGFVGSIFPYHGVDLLIEAIAEVAQKNHHVKGLIVGDGYLLDAYRSKAQDLGVSDRITFTGRVANALIPEYIAAMDIAVMARSNWYGSPVKIFEYGALAKAVIAPDVQPVHDVMEHEQTGLLTKANSSELAAHIERLLSDETIRKQLAEQWSTKVHREHTWKQMARKILDEVPTL